MYKSGTVVTRDTAKMAAYAPVEIGTKGTVGSLIMREIEHFRQLELSSRCSSRKAQPQLKDMVSSTSHLRPTFESVIKTQKKKKRGSKLLPIVCSMVEVSENNRPTSISTYSYRNLRSDGKKLPDVGDTTLMDSNSLVFRELTVPVVPTLMDPPPPFIPASEPYFFSS
ncbi:hypothetical protein D8674_022276 [Pyrus ussuriensis x Pyrus communis]|uniref:Uncharacterized protein n=1 Tax=Pyrus ussuriensis x Pyrus communis TaxID=2448454 RepID=A0A5N5GK18_9ROSA|nr:hypothetical protein D8674_022276 [Pyrus ussuriensis x Pyrus communis]